MHIRWRGLELPYRVVKDERSATPTFGRFTAEPFERGFGTAWIAAHEPEHCIEAVEEEMRSDAGLQCLQSRLGK